jgi:hypothetical protein
MRKVYQVKSNTYRQNILKVFLNLEEKEVEVLISKSVEVLKKRTGMPVFFYRYPLFTSDIHESPYQVESLEISLSKILNISHLEALEYIYSHSDECEIHGCKMVIPIDLMSLQHVLGNGWLFILEDLQNAVLTIKKDVYDFTRLKFIEQIRAGKGKIYVTLSTALTMNYLVDYLIPFTELKHYALAKEERVASHVLRYLSSMLALPDNGILLSTVFERLGMTLCPLDEREVWMHFVDNKEEYKKKGIKQSEGITKFEFNEKQYIRFNKPKTKLKGIKKHIKELSVSGDKKYINFEELELNDALKKKALLIGFKDTELDLLFKMFKNQYVAAEGKYKNLDLLWKRYLESKIPSDKKIVANRGSADNITFTNEMKKIAEEHNLEETDAVDLFKRFKNNYTSKNASRPNWEPLWENYILTHKEFEKKNPMKVATQKTAVENNFYLARLVSSEIKNMLSNQKVSIADVVSGDVEVTDIGFATYPVPPGLGKGEETIFFFKNKSMQEKTIQKYTKESSSVIEITSEGEVR